MIGRMALGANRWVNVEASEGYMGWSQFGGKIMKAVMSCQVRLDRMCYARWSKKLHMLNSCLSKWSKDCTRKARKSGYQYIRSQDEGAHEDVMRMVNERSEGRIGV